MKIKIRKPYLKRCAKYIAITVGVSVVVAIGGTTYTFLTLNQHEKTIQKLVLENTGYLIKYDKLYTTFNNNGEPRIELTNLSLSNPQTKNIFFELKNLNLDLSYQSILYFQPIFSLIEASGSTLFIEFNRKNDILLDDEIMTNLDDKSTSDFDFENWFLNQKQININDVNLSLLDSKHQIQPLVIQNIQFYGLNSSQFQHNYKLKVKFLHSHLASTFNFYGPKFSNPYEWNDASLEINNIGNQGYLVNISAKLQAGRLKYIKTHLDSNQQIFKDYLHDLSKINNFKGDIVFEQESNLNYKLTAPDLTIETKYGLLFDHTAIDGKVKLGQGGNIAISKLKLDGVNNLLKFSNISDDISLAGNIDNLSLNWQGKLLHPHDFNLVSSFSNVKLTSQESNIPSFDNLNGNINARESSGEIKLTLINSTINYPKYLYYPYSWKNFSTNLNWTIESNQLRLNWTNTQLQTPEFKLNTIGSYAQESNNINASVNLEALSLPSIYRLLPKTTPRTLLNDLKNNLHSGNITDLKIKINGTPESFPFRYGGGKLTANGKFNNISYSFMPKWDKISNVSGVISDNNQNFSAKINQGNLGSLNLSNTAININDITRNNLILNVSGVVSGTHNQFIEFANNSPYKQDINKITNIAHIDGDGTLQYKLSLPLEHPQHLKLSGYYDLTNTTISLSSPNLAINNVQGKINFSQSGVIPSIITANTLDSDLEIKALNNKSFELFSPNLNLSSIIESFCYPLESTIQGQTQLKITYNTDTNRLDIMSNLDGITINAPTPLGKSESEIMPLQISSNLNSESMAVNMTLGNNIINAHANFESNFILHNLHIGVGTNQFKLTPEQESIPIVIIAKLDNTFTNQWIDLINNIQDKKNTESNPIMSPITPNDKFEQNMHIQSNESSTIAPNKLLPILFQLQTNAIWINNYNLVGGTITSLISPEQIHTEITMPDIEGQFDYFTKKNSLNIDLKRLMFANSNFYYSDINQFIATINFESNILPFNQIESPIIFESNDLIIKSQQIESYQNNKYFNANILLQESINQLESTSVESEAVSYKNLNLPDIKLYIDNLYIDNFYWGSLRGNINQLNDSIFLENFVLKNNAAITYINGVNHCISCNNNEQYVAINAHSDIHNFGNLVTKTNQGNIFKQGQGKLDLSAIWQGSFSDYQRKNLRLRADVNINDGIILKINPGLFGALMGVINMSSINVTNLNHFNFNSFFGKSFAFKNLNSSLWLESDTLQINDLQLQGDVANVSAFGEYYLESNTINTFLTVEPRLAGTAATTAGIVTLNPLIGLFVYIGEKFIGDPINKALAISYHVEGNVESPNMTQTKISKQLMQNFKSSLNFLKQN